VEGSSGEGGTHIEWRVAGEKEGEEEEKEGEEHMRRRERRMEEGEVHKAKFRFHRLPWKKPWYAKIVSKPYFSSIFSY
jgi:hypothetical protein